MTTIETNAWYGEFGGQYVPETLIAALTQLENAWASTSVEVAAFLDQ